MFRLISVQEQDEDATINAIIDTAKLVGTGIGGALGALWAKWQADRDRNVGSKQDCLNYLDRLHNEELARVTAHADEIKRALRSLTDTFANRSSPLTFLFQDILTDFIQSSDAAITGASRELKNIRAQMQNRPPDNFAGGDPCGRAINQSMHVLSNTAETVADYATAVEETLTAASQIEPVADPVEQAKAMLKAAAESRIAQIAAVAVMGAMLIPHVRAAAAGVQAAQVLGIMPRLMAAARGLPLEPVVAFAWVNMINSQVPEGAAFEILEAQWDRLLDEVLQAAEDRDLIWRVEQWGIEQISCPNNREMLDGLITRLEGSAGSAACNDEIYPSIIDQGHEVMADCPGISAKINELEQAWVERCGG